MKAVLIVFVFAVLMGCGRDRPPADNPADTASAVAQPSPAAPSDTIDKGSVPAEAPTIEMGPVMLTSVRAALHDGADRIVFEFSGPLPGYKVEYVDRPVRQCGSGEVVELPGDAWLSIRFFPANAHTAEGHPSVTARDLTFADRNLKRLKLICDFEAVVEWVAAVAHPLRYKVLELKAPDRLVIDVGKAE
jgi:hypothetical protein